MPYVMSLVSQKGGVGKTSLAVSLSVELARDGLKTLLADLDRQQGSATLWAERRELAELNPGIDHTSPKNIAEAIKLGNKYDALVIDGKPYASAQTAEVTGQSHLTIIPTSASILDLEPAVTLAHELVANGLPPERIAFALNHVSTDSEARAGREYLDTSEYHTLPGHLLYKPSWTKVAEDGIAFTETRFRTVNDTAKEMIAAITDRIAEATK